MKRIENAEIYNDTFYKTRNEDTLYSARTVVDLMTSYMPIQSVVDLGCGVGTWLNVFKSKESVERVLGMDGDYVPQQYLEIERDEFIPVDLTKDFIKELKISGGGAKIRLSNVS